MAGLYRRGRTRVVERAGRRELRIDGTFASSFEPGRVTTGSVWDALAAPLLLLGPRPGPRILLLGLGGGSAARIVRALSPRARITGVEIDPDVVEAARRWLDLDAVGVEIVTADARDYLAGSRGRFDAVLEDVFVGRGRAVHKPAWMLDGGLERAAGRLTARGILASNALDEAPQVSRRLAALFPARLAIRVRDYDNRILVGGPPGLSGAALRSRVAGSPLLAPTLPALHFRTLPSRRESQGTRS